jgi:uncharacterized membrane protein YidH (DUF202 family)
MCEDLLIWILSSLAFVAAFGMAFVPISVFGPSGDAAFGFGLGMIPSFVAVVVGYIAVNNWAMFYRYTKSDVFSHRLRFYVTRFASIGGILAVLMLLNVLAIRLSLRIH